VARVEWARKHIKWDKEWQTVVFSDEKKFNLDGPDGYKYYWHDLRKEKLIFSRRVHGGGTLKVWAGFGWNGKTNIAIIDDTMDASDYQKL